MCLPQESARDALVCRGNPLRSGLLRLDVGRANHLTPLFGFVGKQPPVIGGRAADRVAAQLGKPQLQRRVALFRLAAPALTYLMSDQVQVLFADLVAFFRPISQCRAALFD